MEQAVTLGAYAGAVALPLVQKHADAPTVRVIDGIVRELWAGLPLVYDSSYFDRDMSQEAVERVMTPGFGVDQSRSPAVPADLVSEVLDMVRTFWQLAHRGSPRELAQVVTFRFGELAAGMDSVYAITHNTELQARPGAFEAILRECLELVAGQRARGALRSLGDQDLYEHGIATGTHLLECIDEGSPCRMLTRPQVDLLRLQISTLLTTSGFRFIVDDEAAKPGIRVEVMDDIDPTGRHVAVYWDPGNDDGSGCNAGLEPAGRGGHLSAEVLPRSRVVGVAMAHAIQEILGAAGFEVDVDVDIGESYVLVTALRDPEQLVTFLAGPDDGDFEERDD